MSIQFSRDKNLTTGEGGAVVTDDDAIAARIRVLREDGKHTFITENRTRGFYEYVDTGNSCVQSNTWCPRGVSAEEDWQDERAEEEHCEPLP